MKSINIRNIREVAEIASDLLEEVAKQDDKSNGLRSDAYALFASAVLVASGNETGRNKAGSAVRKSIAKVAVIDENGNPVIDENGKPVVIDRPLFSRGNQSKAERVLAHIAVDHCDGGVFDADTYADAYEFVVAEYGTIWNAYDVLFGDDDDDKDPADVLEALLAKAAKYALKNGVSREVLDLTADRKFGEVYDA